MNLIHTERGQVAAGDFFWLTGPFGRIAIYGDGAVVLSLDFLLYHRQFTFAPSEVLCRSCFRSGSFFFKCEANAEEVIYSTFYRRHIQRVLESVGYVVRPMPFRWINPPET